MTVIPALHAADRHRAPISDVNAQRIISAPESCRPPIGPLIQSVVTGLEV